MAQKEKEAEHKRTQDYKIKEREVLKKQELQNREEEFKIAEDKKKQNVILMKEGEIALDRAKMAIENKEFKEAKNFYREAIKIFKELGWFDQVDILYREVKMASDSKEIYL